MDIHVRSPLLHNLSIDRVVANTCDAPSRTCRKAEDAGAFFGQHAINNLVGDSHDLLHMSWILRFADHEMGDVSAGNQEAAFGQAPIGDAIGVPGRTFVRRGGRTMVQDTSSKR